MRSRPHFKGITRLIRFLPLPLATFASVPGAAQAQVVQDCQPNQYLDRRAPGADRLLTWNLGISTDPERCMRVQVGQTVVWSGDLESHPLAGQGGDSPNPIGLHQNGSVTFTTPGTFGFVCSVHSSMKGAITVVPAASAAPATSEWLAFGTAVALLLVGASLIRSPSSQSSGL
jgi:hypothetical protein